VRERNVRIAKKRPPSGGGKGGIDTEKNELSVKHKCRGENSVERAFVAPKGRKSP